MKKAQFLVIAIAAALLMPTAFLICLEHGGTQNGWSTVSGSTQAAVRSPLPDLSESVDPSSLGAPEDPTDNTTAAVTSGGAVSASFTVVSQPAGAQEETVAAEVDQTPGSQAHTATQIAPEPGGLTAGWALLAATLSMAIAAIGVIAFCRGRARKRALAAEESGDSL